MQPFIYTPGSAHDVQNQLPQCVSRITASFHFSCSDIGATIVLRSRKHKKWKKFIYELGV